MAKYNLSDNQKNVIKKIYSTIKKKKPNSNTITYIDNKMANITKSVKIGSDSYNVTEQKIFLIKENLENQKSLVDEAVDSFRNVNKSSLMKTFNSIPTIKKLKEELKEEISQKSGKKREKIIDLEYKILDEENKIRDNILDKLLEDYYKYLEQKTNTEKKKETISMVNSLFNNSIKIFNYFNEKEMSNTICDKNRINKFLTDKSQKKDFIKFLTNNDISAYDDRGGRVRDELHKATISMKDSEYNSLELEERFSRHKNFSAKDSKELNEKWSSYYKNKEKHIQNSKWYKYLKNSYNTVKSFEKEINNKYGGNVLKEIKTSMYYESIDYYDEENCEYLYVKRDKYGNEVYEYEQVSTPKGAAPTAEVLYNINPLYLNAKLKSEFNKIRNSRLGIKKLESDIKDLNKEIEKDKSLTMSM